MRSFGAVVVIVLWCAIGAAAAPEPPIPDTPAGRVLRAWLTAFNSGDRTQIAAYHARHAPDQSPDQTLAFRQQTGGFELVGIDRSDRLRVDFRVKERTGPTTAAGRIEVKDTDPPTIATFRVLAAPPGTTAADMDVKIDAATRSRVIDAVAGKLTEYYVFADTAAKMIEAVRAHHQRGDYDAITEGITLADRLTEDLRAVSHDKHLRVECSQEVVPKDAPNLGIDRPVPAAMRSRMERDNCGFEKAERLEHNIGYLKFNYFGSPEVCGPIATAAMGFLGNVDAIIFDLRGNGGGDPKMVAWLSSYLFAKRTHLNDLYERKTNKTTEYWTRTELPGKKLADQPAFVLTSSRTFSGAEEFSYNLKNLKRATIVGETTGGGAHPTAARRLDDHFMIGVPFARAVNPITRTNWEGTGVEPDVKVAADQALETATKLAVDRIRNSPAGKN
jgi:hypothetical protein